MTKLMSAQEIAQLLGQPEPTPAQADIIEAPLGSMLVVAGAGSGKTETMSARVVWLIANNIVEPQEVLGLTFTRKAAGELQDRVRLRLTQLARALGEETQTLSVEVLNRPTISTYNSYAASLVKEHGLRIGREPNSRLLSEATSWSIVNEIVTTWQGELGTDKATSTVVDAVLKLANALSEHLLTVDEAKTRILELLAPLEDLPLAPRARTRNAKVSELGQSLSVRYQLLDLVSEYLETKRTTDSVDFGDQVALAAHLASSVKEVGELERERFKVVLLDEYQDTSFAQIKFLSALFGAGHPVTAVGDPNQSIYGWRGASAAGPARFPNQFRNSDGSKASVYKLGTSWRNDQAILHAANLTSAPLYEQDPQNSLPGLEPRPGAGVGHVTGGYFATLDNEMDAIVEFLKAHWKPGERSAAVLCRKRSQFSGIEAALRSAGIPVEVVGLGGLLATPEVVDVVAFLQAVHDPSRGDSAMRLLTGPLFNLGPSDLLALGTLARQQSKVGNRIASSSLEGSTQASVNDPFDQRSILDVIADLDGATNDPSAEISRVGIERISALQGMLEHARSLTYLSVPEMVISAQRLLGLDIEVAVRADASRRRGTPVDPANPFGRAHLDAFEQVAVQFTESAMAPTLGAFLSWLEIAQTQERGLESPMGKPDPHAVQLVTVHASKGLEWDVVVVPGLCDGQFPTLASTGDKGPTDAGWLTDLGALPFPLRGDAQDLPALDYSQAAHDKEVFEKLETFRSDAGNYQLMEERRLAYVAFTRARSELFLSGAWWRTGARPSKPSPFYEELVECGALSPLCDAPAPGPQDSNPMGAREVIAHWPFELAIEQESNSASSNDLEAEQRLAISKTRQLLSRSAQETTDAQVVDGLLSIPMPSATGLDLTDFADLLLKERDAHNTTSQEVEFPQNLSVSAVVEIDRDREKYALLRRRPIPQKPSVASRRGTRFHLWVENHFGVTSLFDLDDLPGADDEYLESDETLESMQKAFLASPWASMTPQSLEQDIDVVFGSIVIRARIDAVFPDPETPGGAIVVDWKTGRAPTDPQEAASRELQLALYRIAWSEFTHTPLEDVKAAFYYVASNTTVWPQHMATREQIQLLLAGNQQ